MPADVRAFWLIFVTWVVVSWTFPALKLLGFLPHMPWATALAPLFLPIAAGCVLGAMALFVWFIITIFAGFSNHE